MRFLNLSEDEKFPVFGILDDIDDSNESHCLWLDKYTWIQLYDDTERDLCVTTARRPATEEEIRLFRIYERLNKI